MRTRLTTLGACLALAACAPMQPRLAELPLPPQRIVQQGYSVVPLNEKGWVRAGYNPQQLTLGKYGANPDETFAVQASLARLPPFTSDDNLARVVKERQVADNNPKRFKFLKHEVRPDGARSARCARSHAIIEDHAAVKRTPTPGHMILEVMNLTCAHLKDRSVGVSVTYSHRYYPGQADPQFAARAAQVLGSVDFTDL